jgi:hypothetical protein
MKEGVCLLLFATFSSHFFSSSHQNLFFMINCVVRSEKKKGWIIIFLDDEFVQVIQCSLRLNLKYS